MDRSIKDKAMASRMKLLKIERTTGKCSICNRTVSLNNMYHHIVKCRGIYK